MSDIGSLIRSARRAKDISQKELAAELGVTDVTISRYESNSVTIPSDKLIRIAELLDIPMTKMVQVRRPGGSVPWTITKGSTLADKLKDAIDIMSDTEQRELSSYVLMILSARNPESSLDKFIGALDNDA